MTDTTHPDRHLQELQAYELTVSNLRAELAAERAQPANDRAAFEAWAKREGLNLRKAEAKEPGGIPSSRFGLRPASFYFDEAECAWRAWANKPITQPVQPAAKDILGAVARGWCHPINAKKVMDSDLAIAISAEVNALLEGQPAAPITQAAQPSQPTDAERLDWLERQDFDSLGFALVSDAPHDGEYRIETDFGTYYGKALREAIDAALTTSKGKT